MFYMNLGFNPINLNNINNITFGRNSIPFKGINSACDRFEKTPFIKKVEIQTREGKPIDAQITKIEPANCHFPVPKDTKPVQFTMDKGNNKFNYYAIAYGIEKDEGFYLDELYADENAERQYKGAGTELLKCVVEESKRRGFNGLVDVAAANCPPPFAFYYKNNFKVISNYSYQNAAIEYAIRKNIPVEDVLGPKNNSLPMRLSPKDAEAFLNNKRIHEERSFDTIGRKVINGDDYEANLIQAPDELNEQYYLQIINNSKKEGKQIFVACFRERTDEEGKKYLEVFNANNAKTCPEDEDYAIEMIEKSAKKLGYENVVINVKRRWKK